MAEVAAWIALVLAGAAIAFNILRTPSARQSPTPKAPPEPAFPAVDHKHRARLKANKSGDWYRCILVVEKIDPKSMGYWQYQPQPWAIFDINDEVILSGHWTFDFRGKESIEVAFMQSDDGRLPYRAEIRTGMLPDLNARVEWVGPNV